MCAATTITTTTSELINWNSPKNASGVKICGKKQYHLNEENKPVFCTLQFSLLTTTFLPPGLAASPFPPRPLTMIRPTILIVISTCSQLSASPYSLVCPLIALHPQVAAVVPTRGLILYPYALRSHITMPWFAFLLTRAQCPQLQSGSLLSPVTVSRPEILHWYAAAQHQNRPARRNIATEM